MRYVHLIDISVLWNNDSLFGSYIPPCKNYLQNRTSEAQRKEICMNVERQSVSDGRSTPPPRPLKSVESLVSVHLYSFLVPSQEISYLRYHNGAAIGSHSN